MFLFLGVTKFQVFIIIWAWFDEEVCDEGEDGIGGTETNSQSQTVARGIARALEIIGVEEHGREESENVDPRKLLRKHNY